jgi:molybdopterin converting factor small subunit
MPTIEVLLPRTLMSVAGDQRKMQVTVAESATLTDVLDQLGASYPILDRRLRDETGAQRRYVNVYLDGEDVRRLDGLATEVGHAREIQIIQSVAGG